MDSRVRDHAETLVDWSARIEAGDNVIVDVDAGAHDLAVAVVEVLGERGANVEVTAGSGEITRAYLTGREASDEPFEPDPDHSLALFETADAYLRLGGGRNTMATADVDPDTRRDYARSRAGIREARLDTDWVSTVHPTRSLAQQAGMSIEAYREFVYNAVLRDWESLANEMGRLTDRLDAGSQVRIRIDRDDRPATDLTVGIENRTAVNSAASVAYDSHNLPSGEVFTAPATVDGTIHFDVPMTIDGRRVRDVTLDVSDGDVVEFEAATNQDALASILETDAGARRFGELGIGMNRGIDRFTDSILFDEKMAGTVHLALGRAYDACLPAGESDNDSAVHVDLIADVSTHASIAIDGEVIQRDGTFRWEEGFTA